MSFFKILETKYSLVNDRKIFEKKWGTYMADFFLTFFFASLIVSTCLLDVFLLIYLFQKAEITLWALFFVASYFRTFIELALDLKPKVTFDVSRTCFPLQVLLTILGMHSITISRIIMKETFINPNTPVILHNCASFPVFCISNENLSIIKIYCYIHVGVRCIPQLFIMSVYIGLSHLSTVKVYLTTANIFLNMVLFSFMISITFPIRKTSRVFICFFCQIFSACNKFLATLCGCCATMLVFMAMFRTVKYYALLGHFLKIVIWMIPCQSFIFIHPFERTWMLYYHFFYLFFALLDLAFLGLCAGADVLDLSYYSTLRFLQVMFLSFFGLLNGLKKGKDCIPEVLVVESTTEIEKN